MVNLAEQDLEQVKKMRASLERWQHSVLNSWEGKDYPELPELKKR